MTKRPNCLHLYLIHCFTQSGKFLTLLFMICTGITFGQQTYTMQRGLPIAEIEPPAGVTPTKLELDALSYEYNIGPNNIGFPFNYFGKPYDKFYVNKRGFVAFGNDYIPYYVEELPIPSYYEPNNMIAFAFSDHHVDNLGGNQTTNYFVTGTQPNRILVINYKNVVCEGETQTTSTQIQLYEQGGKIEIHNIRNISSTHTRTIGLENQNGTVAVTESNLNFSKNINSVNEMIRFVPACYNVPVITASTNFICPPATSATLIGSCPAGTLLWSTGETTTSITVSPPLGLSNYQLSCVAQGCVTGATIQMSKPAVNLDGNSNYCGTYGVNGLYFPDWELWEIWESKTQFKWKLNGNTINTPSYPRVAVTGGGTYVCEVKQGSCSYTSVPRTITDITPTKTDLKSTTFKIAWDESYGNSWTGYASADNPLVLKTPDKGYMIASSHTGAVGNDKSEPGAGESDYWLIKTDSLGKKIWDKTYGTSIDEYLSSFIPTRDGGFVMAGYNSFYVSYQYSTKWYIVKVNSSGTKLWEKIYATTSTANTLSKIVETSDGGFLVGGTTYGGATGDKTQASYGSYDYWIMRLDSEGNKLWDKAYGGKNSDDLKDILTTNDGGYLLGGISDSDSSGVKTSRQKGFYDYWIVKIDANGNKQWDKGFGGADKLFDNRVTFTSFVKSPDGGYLLGGNAVAMYAGGDKSETNVGMVDYWVVKTDANGNKLWDKTFGRKRDDKLAKIEPTSDGGYILAGTTDSEMTEMIDYEFDYWLVKINSSGTKIWEKRTATVKTEALNSIITEPDGKFLLIGTTNSGISMDKTSPRKSSWEDIWMIKINEVDLKYVVNLKPAERFSTELVVHNCSNYITWNDKITFSNQQLVNTMNNEDYLSYKADCAHYGCPKEVMYSSINRCGAAVNISAANMGSEKPEILHVRGTQTVSAEKRILKGNVIFNAGKAIYLNPGFSIDPRDNYFKAEIIDVPCP